MNASCIILAGGRSTRLGHDKVSEIIGKRSLLEQVLYRVVSLCKEVIVVKAKGQIIPDLTSHRNVKTATDILPGRGPLVGIYTGLTESHHLLNLVVAADMPFLNGELLSYMLRLAPGFDLVVPQAGDELEPLHAVYSRNCLPAIETMMEREEFGVNQLARSVRTRYVKSAEIERFDPHHLSFFNINTEADLARARELERTAEK